MRLRLTYPHGYVQKPILAEAIIKLGVPLNILEATVNTKKGEIIVSVEGPEETVEKVVQFFHEKGVGVEKFTYILEIDEGKCISCGACVSPCPVAAISFKPDWTVRFDQEKCVGCGVCVQACPVRAIKLL